MLRESRKFHDDSIDLDSLIAEIGRKIGGVDLGGLPTSLTWFYRDNGEVFAK